MHAYVFYQARNYFYTFCSKLLSTNDVSEMNESDFVVVF